MKKSNIEEITNNLVRLRRELPVLLAELAVAEFQENFRRQKFFDGEKWQERQNEEEEETSRNLLINESFLMNSLSYKIERKGKSTRIKVQSSVDYAQVHNEGGRMKGNKREWRKSKRPWKGEKRHAWRKTEQPAFMPQRQFAGEHPFLTKKIKKLIENKIKKALLIK
jgi:phage gpG-like protein